MKMFCYIIAGCPKVTTSMNMHQSIQHLQPCDSWGPSNHRSHDQFAVSFVPDCSGSGPVSTLFSSLTSRTLFGYGIRCRLGKKNG
uniref:Uncharacterized protein MANES_03G171400 n=1 Tax=Rhizophora mucronata TaxID=61149 RepID=A0A2P2LZ89_RHIMU